MNISVIPGFSGFFGGIFTVFPFTRLGYSRHILLSSGKTIKIENLEFLVGFKSTNNTKSRNQLNNLVSAVRRPVSGVQHCVVTQVLRRKRKSPDTHLVKSINIIDKREVEVNYNQLSPVLCDIRT